MKQSLPFLLSLFFFCLAGQPGAFSQCNADFNFSPDSVCANQAIHFVANPAGNAPSAIYQWSFGKQGADVWHTFTPPTGGGSVVQNVTLIVTDPATGCADTSAVVAVTLQQLPHTCLDDGDLFSDWAFCGSGNYVLMATNCSGTQPTNTFYTIDWGEGAPFSGVSLGSASHTFSSNGNFNIVHTVTGSNGCSNTVTYPFYKGGNPSIGADLPSIGATCSPDTVTITISNWEGNSPGTIYQVFSNSNEYEEPIATFQHPLPDNGEVTVIFNTSSCGFTTATGKINAFDLRVEATNPCGLSSVTLEPIRVSTPPIADFKTTLPPTSCPGQKFTFCDDSIGKTYIITGGSNECTSALQRTWSITPNTYILHNGGDLNDSCIQVSFTVPGMYIVCLNASNPCGSSVECDTFFIALPPTADADAVIAGDGECAPLTVNLLNLSQNGSPDWDIISSPGGNYSGNLNLPNPTVIFTAAGTYTIKLTTANPCSTDTWDTVIVVKAKPVVNLPQPNPICKGESATFSATVQSAADCEPVTCSWSFPGGIPNSFAGCVPPPVQYNSSGPHVVTLTVTNCCGSTTVSKTLTVEEPPVAQVQDTIFKCKSDSTFTLSGSPATGCSWKNLDGSNASNTFNPTTPGTFHRIYHCVTGNCSDWDTQVIVVHDLPPLSLPADLTVCEGSPAFLLAASQPGCLWTGDGLDACGTFNPTTPGIFTLEFCFTDAVTGCKNCKTMTVEVVELPRFDLPDTISLCTSTDLLVLEDLLDIAPSAGVTGEWKQLTTCAFLTLLDPATGTVNTSGTTGCCTFEVTHVRQPGCTWKDTVTIQFIEKPEAVAGEDLKICIAQNFPMPPATPPGGKWLKISGPSHILISDAGQVSVSGSSGGICVFEYVFQENTSCETRDQVQVEVVSLSVPTLQDLHVCETASFLVLGTLPPNHEWLVAQPSPPGLSITTINGERRVNFPTGIPASYSLIYSVIAPGVDNCEVTDEVILHVHQQPEPSWALPDTICKGEPFTFDPVVVSDDPVEYLWDFDGACLPSVEPSPDCNFASTGEYQITLTVRTKHPLTNAVLCDSSISKTIYVSEPPTALFSASTTEICAGLAVHFTNLSLGENISAYHWNFGAAANPPEWDGANPPPVIFQNAPTIVTYPVTLTVTNGCGDRTFQLSVTVLPLPAPKYGFDFEEYCSGDIIQLGYNGVGLPTVFEWWLDGVLMWTVQNPPPFFIEVGDTAVWHFLQLTTKNDCGDSTYLDSVLIRPTDVKAFIHANKDKICQGEPLKLTSFSTPGAPLDWDIFDENGNLIFTGNQDSLDFEFPAPGTYRIVLRAFGCGFDGDTLWVVVNALPVVGFTCGDCRVCQDISLNFNPLPPLVSQYAWEFGDGGGSMETFPAHPFGSSETFTVLLVGTDENGCSASAERQVTVDTLPVASFVGDLEICEGDLVSLTNLSQMPVACEWSHPLLANGGCNPSAVFSEAGMYPITLTVTDLQGCKGQQTQWLQVADAPTAGFAAQFSGDCTPVSAVFTNQSLDGTEFQWFINDSLVAATTDFSYVFTGGGVFEVKLVAIHAGFCSDAYSQTFEIHGTPVADYAYPDTAHCSVFTNTFQNLSTGGGNLSYDWTFFNADGVPGKSYLENPTFQYFQQGTFEVQLIAGTPFCKDTFLGEVTVHPPLAATFEVDTIRCFGDAAGGIQTTVTSGMAAFGFAWSKAEDPQFMSFSQHLSGLMAGTYNLSLTDGNHCTFTASVPVPQPPQPLSHMVLREKIVTCFGESDGELVAWGAGGTEPYSILWQNGSPDSAQTDLSAGAYFFTLTDDNGCTYTADVPLAQNPQLEMQDSLKHLTCFGDDDGVIELTSLTGGLPFHTGGFPSYLVTLSGNGKTWTGTRFGELEPGGYDLLVLDSAGCELEAHWEIMEPMPIDVDIFPHKMPNDTVTKLGALLQLVTDYDAMQATFFWQSPDWVDCPVCPSPFARVVNPTTLIVFLTDLYGCIVSDTVRISVEKDRSVAIPNAFSPNGDGMNDVFFVLSGNPAVTAVKSLRVLDRWGAVFFEVKNSLPNDEAAGWDGNYKGKPVQAGGYTWQAEISYLDGETIGLEGIVRLIR